MHVLTKVSRVVPFGMRFRDESTGHFIGDGLVVRAFPPSRPSLSRHAFVTPSKVWVLQDLPGLRDFEMNGEGALPKASPKRFTVELLDTLGRFLPLSFHADLPSHGLFSPVPLSPPSAEPSVPLFSAPTRQASRTLAVLRAELWDTTHDAPASWARLELSVGDGAPARGVADDKGRIALFFQYPAPEDFAPATAGSGSSFSQGPPLLSQTWTVRLSAFYAHRSPVREFPELDDTLGQPPARLWPDLSGAQDHIERTLRFDQELVVRTQNDSLSRLRLTPTGSLP
ncbi:Hypothetical protein AA314_04529 [Archangium gephyra]|uniref:Uncharacterized protein n=1 Tax=Archangium gephyra TaxID=48 RepID=A0AAC8Q996_9BACT|nr:Hypothetical protein AA314_04529 [Archangium gephyra]